MTKRKRLASLSLAVTMAFSSTASVLAEVSAQSIQATAEISAWSRDNASSGMYAPNTKVTHNGKVWLQISSEICWWDEPGSNDAVWQEYSVIEGDTSFIKPWDQDFAVNNGYVVGSQVTHNGITWEQVWDRTCWWEEPGTNESIWKEVETNVNPEASNSDIYLTESTYLVYNEEDGYYSITEGFTSLSGGVNSKYSVSNITVEVYIGQLCVYSETMTGSNKFNLDNISLLQGANFLKITAETIDNQALEAEFIILNFTEDNIGDFEIDMEDNDGDGLENYYEDILGTDKNNADTDGDGLSDSEEIELTGTDPTKVDSDDNGIWDGDEDTDNDGLTNLEEILLGTLPYSNDTDFDGIPDGDEVKLGTDPLNADSDGDGVKDGDELRFGLDPLKQDSFDDGIIDCDREFEYVLVNPDEREDDLVKVDVVVHGTISEIDSYSVDHISENNIFLNTKVPGFISNAFDIVVPEDGEVYATFELDDSIFVSDDVVPAAYFWNEEIQFLEKLDTVNLTRSFDETFTIKLQNSGKIIVLDSTIQNDVWNIDLMFPNSTVTEDIDIVFTIDSSGSMTSMDGSGIRKSATIDFINLLSDTDQGAVVDFDSYAMLLQGLTSDKEALINAVNRIDSSGGTNIYAGLNLALAQFDYSTALGYSQYSFLDELMVEDEMQLFLLEDGENNPEIQVFSASEPESRVANRYVFLLTDGAGTTTNYSTLITEANAKNVQVYCVGLGSGVSTTVMTDIAEKTGGKYVHANNADELKLVFQSISDDLIDYNSDSDGDMLNDYYEKKLTSGELRLGTGEPLIGLDFENPDSDGDGLLDGEEIVVVSTTIDDSTGQTANTVVYVRMNSNPLCDDTDGDGIRDRTDADPLTYTITDKTLALVAALSYNNLESLVNHSLFKTIGDIVGAGVALTNLNERQYLNDYSTPLWNAKIIAANDSNFLGATDSDKFDKGLGAVAVEIERYGMADAVILGFRGSEFILDKKNDALTDLILSVSGSSTQSSYAYLEYMSLANDPSKEYYIAGHSLGGRLVQDTLYSVYEAKERGSSVQLPKYSATFNGLGYLALVYSSLNDSITGQYEKTLTNYYMLGDLVGQGLGASKAGTYLRTGTDEIPLFARTETGELILENTSVYSGGAVHGIVLFHYNAGLNAETLESRN